MAVETANMVLDEAILSGMWKIFIGSLPGILGAFVVLLIGFFIAWFCYFLASKLMNLLELDRWLIHELGGKNVIGTFKISHFISYVIRWYVFILFLPLAAKVVGVASISEFLLGLYSWVPNIILVVFIVIAGILVANYVKNKVEHFEFHGSAQVGLISKITVLIFTFLISLQRLGVDTSIASDSFLIILAGVVLAFALAFGLGMKDEAQEMIKGIKKKL